MNPYEPPISLTQDGGDAEYLIVPVVAELVMTEEYVRLALTRSRRRDPVYHFWKFARWPCCALLLVLTGAAAYSEVFVYFLLLVTFTFSVFFAYPINYWYYIWEMKRSGTLNVPCRVTLSQSGYRTEIQGFDMTWPWSSFRGADILDDGCLLFQSRHSSPWIPWSSIPSMSDRDRLIAFIRTTFPPKSIRY